jgi:hypothetical protein
MKLNKVLVDIFRMASPFHMDPPSEWTACGDLITVLRGGIKSGRIDGASLVKGEDAGKITKENRPGKVAKMRSGRGVWEGQFARHYPGTLKQLQSNTPFVLAPKPFRSVVVMSYQPPSSP